MIHPFPIGVLTSTLIFTLIILSFIFHDLSDFNDDEIAFLLVRQVYCTLGAGYIYAIS